MKGKIRWEKFRARDRDGQEGNRYRYGYNDVLADSKLARKHSSNFLELQFFIRPVIGVEALLAGYVNVSLAGNSLVCLIEPPR